MHKLEVDEKDEMRILKGKYRCSSIHITYPIPMHHYAFQKDSQGINFHIEKGDVVFITGPTGGGKSRFIHTLLGNSTDYVGSIKIGETVLGKHQLSGVGYVPQTTMLFNDSLIHNITLHSDKIDEEKLEKSLSIANLEDDTLKEMIRTHNLIGMNGKKLSEGQRQRVSITRGIYHSDECMILDNVLNNLDQDNKIKIFKSLLASNITLIIGSNDVELKRACENL